jgi:replicative DNA helicase
MSEFQPMWRHISEVYMEGLEYMHDRREGLITSIRTPWYEWNDAMMDGIEWNTINVIAGRPGSGKTLIANQITREAFALNPSEQLAILECQWEMVGRNQALREISGALGRTLRDLNSVDAKLSREEMEAAQNYCLSRGHLPVYTIENPLTVLGFERQVTGFCEAHPGKKIIVSVDHSLLFRKAQGEKDKFEMLHNLGETLTRMKKTLPVMFIILSQLNRDPESTERMKEGTHGNYLLDSDVYGGDALLQHADSLVMINRPAKYNWKFYGPEQYVVPLDGNMLAFHFNKVRNGEPRIRFFQAEFAKMRIKEFPKGYEPPRKQSRLQTARNTP